MNFFHISKRSLSIVFSILFASFFFQASAESAKPIKEFILAFEKTYKATSKMKANFEQIITTNFTQKKLSGIIHFKKPKQIRFAYEKPRKKLFIADGNFFWMEDIDDDDDKKVIKISMKSAEIPIQFRFLLGQGKLEDDFTISYLTDKDIGQKGNTLLKLVPKKPGAKFKYLVLGIDPATYMLKETIAYDLQNGMNHFIFNQIETNLEKGIEDAIFEYTPPADIKVIEK